MPKIFISYSRRDKDVADYIAGELRSRGAEVFIDYQRIQAGESFPRRLASEIDSSSAIVFLLSKHSVTSKWVISEVYYAHQQDKLIVPVMLDATKLPGDLFFLSPIDRVDFIGWSKDVHIEDSLRKLIVALSLSEGITGTEKLLQAESPLRISIEHKPLSSRRSLPGMIIIILPLIIGIVGAILILRNSLVPTFVPTMTGLQLAVQGVEVNADWKPYSQEFNGVEMVLIPVGCFDMGSNDGEDDEKPVDEFCFDQPFWIDRTEVTNKQYGLTGYFSGDNRPREDISWNQAQDFCAVRDARLPTEAEWEYAARGPDALRYPWGNDFVPENAIYDRKPNPGSAVVGSVFAGRSWVGALDMSGNVWEWVSSVYAPYPYDPNDGREDFGRIDAHRVLRGGSWHDILTVGLEATYRVNFPPSFRDNYVGFRCALDYEDGK